MFKINKETVIRVQYTGEPEDIADLMRQMFVDKIELVSKDFDYNQMEEPEWSVTFCLTSDELEKLNRTVINLEKEKNSHLTS